MEAFDQDDLQNAILCVWKEARGDTKPWMPFLNTLLTSMLRTS